MPREFKEFLDAQQGGPPNALLGAVVVRSVLWSVLKYVHAYPLGASQWQQLAEQGVVTMGARTLVRPSARNGPVKEGYLSVLLLPWFPSGFWTGSFSVVRVMPQAP